MRTVRTWEEMRLALAQARIGQGLSQAGLARLLYLSRTAVNMRESGYRGMSGEDLLATADALELDIVLVPRVRAERAADHQARRAVTTSDELVGRVPIRAMDQG